MPISQYDVLNYAQYTPRTTQEIWAPLQYMRENHDRLQEEYAQQEQQGGLSLLGIDPVKDKAAYDIQQNYIAKTKEAADQLATKGFIDAGRRRNLMELKSLYTNQVVPLQNQLKIRQERAEELRKIQLQDPTFRATINPNDISLTDGLKSPTAFNYDGVSGNQLYSTAAKKLEQLSKTINQDIPELKKMPKLSFQYFTAIQSGATPEQAASAMKREGYDPSTVDKMTNMIHETIDSAMQEFGVYDKFKNDPKTIEELWNTTSQAAYNAIGTKQFGQVHDSWGEGNARLAQQQQNNQIDYAPTDVDEDPEITDSDRYNKINKDLSILKTLLKGGKYTPSSYYKNSKEFKDYETALKKRQNELSKNPNQNTITGYGVTIALPSNYAEYQKSKQIESIANKYGIRRFDKLQSKLESDLDNMRKMSKIMWVDDNKDVAKKHYLQNIISNKVQSQKFEDEIGISPQEILNDHKKLGILRFGINPRRGLFAQYSESPSKHKKVSLDYGISGNSYSSTDSRVNAAYNKAFEGNLSGNDLVATGHFRKVNGGYETTTMSDRNNKPIFVSDDDIKSGLDNETISILFNNILNKVYWNNSSYARASVDAEPTKVGGGK